MKNWIPQAGFEVRVRPINGFPTLGGRRGVIRSIDNRWGVYCLVQVTLSDNGKDIWLRSDQIEALDTEA